MSRKRVAGFAVLAAMGEKSASGLSMSGKRAETIVCEKEFTNARLPTDLEQCCFSVQYKY